MRNTFTVDWKSDMLIVLLDPGIPLHFQSNGFGISLLNKKSFRRHLLDIFSLRKESRVRYFEKKFFCCNFCLIFFNISNGVSAWFILRFIFWLELTIFHTLWIIVYHPTVNYFKVKNLQFSFHSNETT